jgi:uncharacterized membrane protein YgdD (TMEM256/DUF423 family)
MMEHASIPRSARIFILLGALNAALAVIAGAYGAHALNPAAAVQAGWYQTALQYHLFHALGLIAVGLVSAQRRPTAWLVTSGSLMLAGIVLFCASLYVSAISAYRLTPFAPFGGTAFIVAWLLLMIALLRP